MARGTSHLVYPELPRDNFKDGDGIAREAALLLLEDVAVAEVVHQVAALLGVQRLQVGVGVRPHIGHGGVEQQRHYGGHVCKAGHVSRYLISTKIITKDITDIIR